MHLMLRKILASPMSMADGSLVYAAKDNMKLVKYDLKNDSLEEFEEDVYTLCRLIAR